MINGNISFIFFFADILPTVATKGEGLNEALEWLANICKGNDSSQELSLHRVERMDNYSSWTEYFKSFIKPVNGSKQSHKSHTEIDS